MVPAPVPTAFVARGLLDGDGLLPTFSLSLPGVGDLTSILGLPGASSSTTSTTSASSTLTTDSVTTSATESTTSTLSSTTSASTLTSDTTSTTSAASTSATSTTSLTTSASTTLETSNTATQTLATSTSLPSDTATASSLSSSSSSSVTASATAAADTASKNGFLQNKALSVGVITASVLVGLVLLAFLATWALRKRRNDRINQDIIDFSNAGLVTAAAHDSEKGGRFGDNDGGSSSGHGSTGAVAPSRMYQDTAAAYPTYTPPSQAAYNAGGAGGYAASTYSSNAYAYPQRNNTYDNWGYYQGAPAAGGAMGNPYDQQQSYAVSAYGGMAESYAAAGGAMAGVGAGAQQQQPLQRRPSAQRKPAPPLSISSANGFVTGAPTGPDSTTSLSNPPLQPAADLNSAAPAGGEPRRLVVRNE